MPECCCAERRCGPGLLLLLRLNAGSAAIPDRPHSRGFALLNLRERSDGRGPGSLQRERLLPLQPRRLSAPPKSAAAAEACWQAAGASRQAARGIKPAPGWLRLHLVGRPGDVSVAGAWCEGSQGPRGAAPSSSSPGVQGLPLVPRLPLRERGPVLTGVQPDNV